MTKHLIAVLLCLHSAACFGASVIDQNWTPQEGGWSSLGGMGAQVFTVGAKGVLDRVEVPLRPNYIDVEPNRRAITDLSLLRVINGVPSPLPADVIATATFDLPEASSPVYSDLGYLKTFRWVSLSGLGLNVNVGDQYAIAVGTLDPTNAANERWEWVTSFESTLPSEYLGGAGWMRRPTDTVFAPPPADHRIRDFGFRTFITPVPEPSAAAMVTLTMASLALRRGK